jgi:hypothetical protein
MRDSSELENESYNPSIIRDLEQADWKAILTQLLYFAENQCRKFYWLGNQHLHPQDLVQEAIALAFGCGKNGGYRNWNKNYYPDLPSFLKGVIKSIVSHKIEHLKKFPHDSIEPEEQKANEPVEDDAKIAKSIYGGISQDSPEDSILNIENKKLLSERVLKLKYLSDDDEDIGLVMICFEDGISTPREIAEATGYDIATVYNILKRIRRKARNIK